MYVAAFSVYAIVYVGMDVSLYNMFVGDSLVNGKTQNETDDGVRSP